MCKIGETLIKLCYTLICVRITGSHLHKKKKKTDRKKTSKDRLAIKGRIICPLTKSVERQTCALECIFIQTKTLNKCIKSALQKFGFDSAEITLS